MDGEARVDGGPATQGDGASAEGPLHRRILADIEARILSGDWPPGHRLPFEQDLAAQWGCSRMTVNKALTQLVRGGLIERRRKAGSFVRQAPSQSAVLAIPDIPAEVAALGLPYRFEVLSRRRRRATAADRARLGLAGEGIVLAIACRHRAGPATFCVEDRLVSLDAVPEAADETFAEVPPGTWLVRRVPWTAAEHRISAVAADAALARLAGIAEGAPCLAVERRTWSSGQPVTAVRLVYPGDSHAFVARFEPPRG